MRLIGLVKLAKQKLGFNWIQLILFLINHLPEIIDLIKKIIDLFSGADGISGQVGRDETERVQAARRHLRDLADKVGVGVPSDLVV
jgi:hypothetical protein